MGKKNWLFIGHPNAGQNAAVIYSIAVSCERFKINLQEYLRMLFTLDLQSMSQEQRRNLIPRFTQNRCLHPPPDYEVNFGALTLARRRGDGLSWFQLAVVKVRLLPLATVMLLSPAVRATATVVLAAG